MDFLENMLHVSIVDSLPARAYQSSILGHTESRQISSCDLYFRACTQARRDFSDSSQATSAKSEKQKFMRNEKPFVSGRKFTNHMVSEI